MTMSWFSCHRYYHLYPISNLLLLIFGILQYHREREGILEIFSISKSLCWSFKEVLSHKRIFEVANTSNISNVFSTTPATATITQMSCHPLSIIKDLPRPAAKTLLSLSVLTWREDQGNPQGTLHEWHQHFRVTRAMSPSFRPTLTASRRKHPQNNFLSPQDIVSINRNTAAK